MVHCHITHHIVDKEVEQDPSFVVIVVLVCPTKVMFKSHTMTLVHQPLAGLNRFRRFLLAVQMPTEKRCLVLQGLPS